MLPDGGKTKNAMARRDKKKLCAQAAKLQARDLRPNALSQNGDRGSPWLTALLFLCCQARMLGHTGRRGNREHPPTLSAGVCWIMRGHENNPWTVERTGFIH